MLVASSDSGVGVPCFGVGDYLIGSTSTPPEWFWSRTLLMFMPLLWIREPIVFIRWSRLTLVGLRKRVLSSIEF